MELERELDTHRQEIYTSLVRHLVVLIALTGDVQLYPASRASRY